MLRKLYCTLIIALCCFNFLNAIDTTSEDVEKIIKVYRKSLPKIPREISKEIPLEQHIINFLKRFHPNHTTLEGDKILSSRIHNILEQGNGLTFLLPANPYKSRNTERKTLGLDPDLGEMLEIITLQHICSSISAICNQPIKCVLISDGSAFNDILRVHEDEGREYVSKVRQLIYALGADDVLTLMMLGDFPWHSFI